MYADDTVLYVHVLTKTEVAAKLTNAVVSGTASVSNTSYVASLPLYLSDADSCLSCMLHVF